MCSHCPCKNGPSAAADCPSCWQLLIKICLKALSSVCLLASMLTRQRRAALIICAETSKQKEAPEYMDSQMALETWTEWFAYFVVNLITNISCTSITVELLYFFPCCVHVATAFSDALFAILRRGIEKKRHWCWWTDSWLCVNRVRAWVSRPKFLTCQKFI